MHGSQFLAWLQDELHRLTLKMLDEFLSRKTWFLKLNATKEFLPQVYLKLNVINNQKIVLKGPAETDRMNIANLENSYLKDKDAVLHELVVSDPSEFVGWSVPFC